MSLYLEINAHTETLHTGTGVCPRFHPACFPWKTIFIHTMITESPGRIGAALRWFSYELFGSAYSL